VDKVSSRIIVSSLVMPNRDQKLLERYTMAYFYYSTNGPSWGDEYNFMSTTDSVCKWQYEGTGFKGSGVHCHSDGTINVINFGFDDSINGTIPRELGLLTNIIFGMGLYNLQLTGTIPSEIGQLAKAQFLLLDDNQLTGTIPSELGQLEGLREDLSLKNNSLTGTIPSELGQVAMFSLDLSDNSLTGTIPSEIGQVTQLYSLFFQSNQLTGTIPSELGQFTRMDTLYLHNNRLTGNIDPIFCDNSRSFGDVRVDCTGDPLKIICSCCHECPEA